MMMIMCMACGCGENNPVMVEAAHAHGETGHSETRH